MIVADASNTAAIASEGLEPCPAAALRTSVNPAGCWAAIVSKLRAPGTVPVCFTFAAAGHTWGIFTDGLIIRADVSTWPVFFISVKYCVMRTSRLSLAIVPIDRYTNCVSPTGRPFFDHTVKNTAPEHEAKRDLKKHLLSAPRPVMHSFGVIVRAGSG
ncbi:hypothetical protein KN815_23455 [Streptomyces sp. 4503]|uniref:Uncharacterized protein n=1 Tax=Streptomyces niphimycinicus TaxID=2842201 RepID=A0ABS6CIZ5_9ACTN|nr:hypothetical protein [Streptomyces niphimycinicus]MBU3866913.1 hypothetical protein [Streptomyces niphimycinicus]